MTHRLLALFAAGLVAPAAHAGPEFQASGAYSGFDGQDATLSGATVRGTAFLYNHFGVEFEYSTGMGSETVGGAEIELDNQVSVYAIGRVPIGERFELLGRVGYGSSAFSVEYNDASGSVDVDGLAIGVGAQYFFTDRIGIRADASSFESNEDEIEGTLDIYSIGIVLRF